MLIGPKGAGKSFIGYTLQESLGIAFIPVDQIWLVLKKTRNDYGSIEFREEGFRQMYSQAQAAFQSHDAICMESTGVGAQKQSFINSLSTLGKLFLVHVTASEKTCLQRIGARDNSGHIPKNEIQIDEVNKQSLALQMPWNLVLDNDKSLNADEIVGYFKPLV